MLLYLFFCVCQIIIDFLLESYNQGGSAKK